jgi:hypothetical protein
LVDPGYDKQLTSLDDILQSGIAFGYQSDLKMFFESSSDLRYKVVVERGELCSTSAVCIDRIRKSGNFASYAPVWVVQNYTNVFNDHSTVCLVNGYDYDIGFIAIYLQKGSFFLESMNKFIALSVESGMIDKKVRSSVYMSRPIHNTTDVSDGYFVFTLNHLRIAFYILFVGHGVSFVLFLCEMFYHFRLRYV